MKKRKVPGERAEDCIRAYHGAGQETDIQGSYTGICRLSSGIGAPVYSPYDSRFDVRDEVPVQDADDL